MSVFLASLQPATPEEIPLGPQEGRRPRFEAPPSGPQEGIGEEGEGHAVSFHSSTLGSLE